MRLDLSQRGGTQGQHLRLGRLVVQHPPDRLAVSIGGDIGRIGIQPAPKPGLVLHARRHAAVHAREPEGGGVACVDRDGNHQRFPSIRSSFSAVIARTMCFSTALTEMPNRRAIWG